MNEFEPKELQSSKGSISEEDISTLLQRYSATTVLTLLQEVANFPGAKIDWDRLVTKTSTGISNAREYQMLWRHLAYRDALLDRLEDEAEPLDDDSDLEFELEATTAVNYESSVGVAPYVKVLIASGLPSELAITNNSTVEASLTTNIPNGQSLKGRSESSLAPSCSTIPYSVQKQPSRTVSSAGGLDGNLTQKKKRKPWSKSEDLELIAAVQKFGEGNWANILRGNFKGERTASQLSQRWAIIRKRQKNLIGGGGTLTSSAQLSEAQLAARHAMSLALNLPAKNLTSGTSNRQAQNQSQAALMLSKPSPAVEPRMMEKSVVSIKRSPPKPDTDPDSMGIKAAAVAAGARIATPSDAASLMIAAQAKKAVHIIPSGGGSVIKHTISGGSAISGALPNVRHVRTGLSSPADSSQAATASNCMHTSSVKLNSNTVCSSPALATQQAGTNLVESPKPPSEKEAKCDEERDVAEPGNVPKEQSQVDGARVSDNAASQQVEMSTAPQTHAEPREQVHVEDVKEGESPDHDKTTVHSDAVAGETRLAEDLAGLEEDKSAAALS